MPARNGYRSLSCSLAFLTSVGALVLAGCGAGSSVTNLGVVPASLTGQLNGGPNPVTGATVSLYATQSNGYGGAGLLLATTTTDSTGSFSFGPKNYSCPAGQQAYITAAGGNTGANTANANSLLMAALGPCANIGVNTHILINELSTVAAGYALSNFISITGNGSSAVVAVSAPANNNAAAPNCLGTGTAMQCAAGGLTHAFQNAANLVDAVQFGTPRPTGTTFTVTPSNANGAVPTLLINTLGNIVQACVNSTGGASGDNTTCGTLFANTTPPTTSTTSPVTPTNTLQAVVNLAKFPTMTPAKVSAIFALQPATNFYTPNLATAPNDYSLAVTYKGPTGSSNYYYGFYTTLDVNDQVYTFAELGNGTGPVVMNQIASNGSGGSTSASIPGALCIAASPCVGATDTNGHVWLANTTTTAMSLYELNIVDNSLAQTITFPSTTAPNSVAVDTNNTVYVTSANNTAPNLYQVAANGTTATTVMAGGAPVQETVTAPQYLILDQKGSIWNTNYNGTTAGTSNVTISYLANTGSVGSPTYSVPVTSVLSSSVVAPYSVLIDSAGNGWVTSLTTLFKVAAGATSPSSTYTISGPGGASATPVPATGARFGTLDGDGNIFLPDNSKSTLYQFFPATGNFTFLSPCAGTSGTACSTTGARPINAPRNAVADSTGSIWITNPVVSTNTTNFGNVTQIIGTAAPTWGQLSNGKAGVRPN